MNPHSTFAGINQEHNPSTFIDILSENPVIAPEAPPVTKPSAPPNAPPERREEPDRPWRVPEITPDTETPPKGEGELPDSDLELPRRAGDGKMLRRAERLYTPTQYAGHVT